VLPQGLDHGPLVNKSNRKRELWSPLRSTEYTDKSRSNWQIKGPSSPLLNLFSFMEYGLIRTCSALVLNSI